jgi:hypothetical protein
MRGVSKKREAADEKEKTRKQSRGFPGISRSRFLLLLWISGSVPVARFPHVIFFFFFDGWQQLPSAKTNFGKDAKDMAVGTRSSGRKRKSPSLEKGNELNALEVLGSGFQTGTSFFHFCETLVDHPNCFVKGLNQDLNKGKEDSKFAPSHSSHGSTETLVVESSSEENRFQRGSKRRKTPSVPGKPLPQGKGKSHAAEGKAEAPTKENKSDSSESSAEISESSSDSSPRRKGPTALQYNQLKRKYDSTKRELAKTNKALEKKNTKFNNKKNALEEKEKRVER